MVYGRGVTLMKGFLTLYKIEQKLFFRSPDVFVFNLCMPVVVLLLIGFIAVPQAPPDFWPPLSAERQKV